jgi:hypothetical protein
MFRGILAVGLLLVLVVAAFHGDRPTTDTTVKTLRDEHPFPRSA